MSKLFLFFCLLALIVGVWSGSFLLGLGTLIVGIIIKIMLNLKR